MNEETLHKQDSKKLSQEKKKNKKNFQQLHDRKYWYKIRYEKGHIAFLNT